MDNIDTAAIGDIPHYVMHEDEDGSWVLPPVFTGIVNGLLWQEQGGSIMIYRYEVPDGVGGCYEMEEVRAVTTIVHHGREAITGNALPPPDIPTRLKRLWANFEFERTGSPTAGQTVAPSSAS